MSGQKQMPPRRLQRSSIRICEMSEGEAQCQLCLQRIAYTLPQEAVKVKQARRHQRIHIVLVVEAVEHLHHRNQRVAIAELERPQRAPVKGEEAVVFAQM